MIMRPTWQRIGQIVLLAALACAAASVPGPAPRLDAWRIIGMGGGGTMIGPTISPFDSNLVFEHCDMTGAYVTADAGQSWRMFNLHSVVEAFAFDPSDANVIYAATSALFRSNNRGQTWSLVWPDPAKNTVEHMEGDHADFVLTTNDPSYPASRAGVRIHAVAVDPSDARRILLAAGAGRGAASLIGTEDSGRNWKTLTTLADTAIHHLYVAGAPGASRAYVIGNSGVTAGWGHEWRHSAGPAGLPVRFASAGRTRTGGVILYATTGSKWGGAQVTGGVFVSSDGGETWQPRSAALISQLYRPGTGNAPQFRAIAASAKNAEIAYAAFQDLQLGPGPARRFNGIAKTTDAGAHWTIVHKESNHASKNLEGSWIEGRAPAGGQDIWFDVPYSLGVAPGNPDVCYATDLFRTYRTLDGGKTWQQVNSVKAGPDRWTTRGLDVTTNYGVHFDPFDQRRMLISYTDAGAFRSEDGGATWTGATVGVPNRWRNTTYWVAYDPEVKGLVWGAFSGVHDLPRPKMWRHRDTDTYVGGVGVSLDGGATWHRSNAGMPETSVTHILLDSSAGRAGARVLYATGFGRGVFKSVNNGRSWTLVNGGIEQVKPKAWRLSQASDGALYLVVARTNERGLPGDQGDGALYKSTNGAGSWVRMRLPEGVNGPNALTPDPRNPNRLYLSAWGIEHSGGDDTGGGVYVTDNGGESWQPLFTGSQHVYDLTADPAHPGRLYICGFDVGVFRSDDSGKTWRRLRGFNFKWGHRVILDPADATKIYVNTYGGSVWHGPADGDAGATEDIVPAIPRAPGSGLE